MNNYKCVLVGDGGVGKTTFVKRLLTNKFEKRYVATLGVDVHPITREQSTFNIWDTAGREEFGGLRNGYYVGANCGIICFDLTCPDSFKNAFRWIQDVEKYTKKLVLVGFKGDLPHKVTKDEILQSPYKYIEVSNLMGSGINEIFSHLKMLQ